MPVGRSQQINGALVIRDIKKSDTGSYICVATSARVSDVEAAADVEIVQHFRGEQPLNTLQ